MARGASRRRGIRQPVEHRDHCGAERARTTGERKSLCIANAISHWFWGDQAALHNGPSARHTLMGHAIHHASATLWAVVYEKWFGGKAGKKAILLTLAGAAAVAALARLGDYKMAPRRLRPGYEMRLSARSLFLFFMPHSVWLSHCAV